MLRFNVMIIDLDLHLPRGWPIVLLLVAGATVFCGIWWRRYWVFAAASCSVSITVATVILLFVSWGTLRVVGLDWTVQPRAGYGVDVSSSRGRFRFGLDVYRDTPPMPWPGRLLVIHEANRAELRYYGSKYSFLPDWPFLKERLGFDVVRRVGVHTDNYYLTLPHWFVMILCMPFPAIWVRRRMRRRHRLRHALCLKCGYDLRATPAGGKCQECGMTVPDGHRPTVGPAPVPPGTPAGR